jgi:hypothetical protein
VTPVKQVDRAGQAGGNNSRTTNVPESLSDFSRPWNKNTPKTQLAWKKNPTQNLEKQLQPDQELSSNTTTQRNTSQATHLIGRLHHFVFTPSFFSHLLKGTMAETSLVRMFRSASRVGTCY